MRKDSKFLPEAWTRVGEFHFDNPNELRLAIAAFHKVLAFKDSPYYDRALYKLAWSYYRDNRFPEAVREFDNLVKYADARTEAGPEGRLRPAPGGGAVPGRQLRRARLGRRHLPDPDQRPAARDRVLQGPREARSTSARSSSAWATSTSTRRSTQEAIAVYKTLLSKWPYYSDAPRVQDRIVHAYEKDRNLVAAAKEREQLGRHYTKGSDWYQHNKDNPDAAGGCAAAGRGRAAHRGHQRPRRRPGLQDEVAGEPEGHGQARGVQEALRHGGRALRKYLAAYPNSKRVYEFSAFYADALYYSGQLPEAISAYKTSATRSSTTATRKTPPSGSSRPTKRSSTI